MTEIPKTRERRRGTWGPVPTSFMGNLPPNNLGLIKSRITVYIFQLLQDSPNRLPYSINASQVPEKVQTHSHLLSLIQFLHIKYSGSPNSHPTFPVPLISCSSPPYPMLYPTPLHAVPECSMHAQTCRLLSMHFPGPGILLLKWTNSFKAQFKQLSL